MSRFALGDFPVFADIEDMDFVYRMVLDMREKADQLAEPRKTW